MGSKLGLILSLFFAVFVFVFAVDLINLQANYANLESIANTVSLLLGENGGANVSQIRLYVLQHPGVTIEYDDSYFKVGEFKEFTLSKEYKGFLVFKDPIDIKVSRTVLIGQFERIY